MGGIPYFRHTADITGCVLKYLMAAQVGLTITDLKSLLCSKLKVNQSGFKVQAILSDLGALLAVNYIHGTPHYRISYSSLFTKIQNRYGYISECLEDLEDYLSKSIEAADNKSDATDLMQYEQLLHAMIDLGNTESMLVEYIFNLPKLCKIIQGINIFTLIHILDLAERSLDDDKDIMCLSNILKEHVHLLTFAPGHFAGMCTCMFYCGQLWV